MTSGVSTPVYRIRRGGVTHYLRLAESPAANLAPEVLAHRLLRERGVSVSEVVAFTPFDATLGRSWMITTAVPGGSLATAHQGIAVDNVLRAAGRDLARLHTVPVTGFGWIRRDPSSWTSLRAPQPTLRAFALEDLDAHLGALGGWLASAEIEAIARLIAGSASLLTAPRACLVHGDFDTTHIFRDRGRYTGIIDLGEIRGADPFYDLGHFALHDGEQMPSRTLPPLLAGYAEVTPLPPDSECLIRLWSLLIGVRALARSINRPRSAYQAHLVSALRRTLAEEAA